MNIAAHFTWKSSAPLWEKTWLPDYQALKNSLSALLSSPRQAMAQREQHTPCWLIPHASCFQTHTHTHLLSIDKWSLWAGLTLMEFCSACLPERCKCCQLTLIPQPMRFSLSVSLLRLISSFCSPVHLLGLIIERRVENSSRDKQDQGPELPFWSYLPMAGELRFFFFCTAKYFLSATKHGFFSLWQRNC